MLTVSSGRWSVSCTGGKHLIYIFTNGTWQNLVKNLSLPNFQVNYCELIWKMSVITYLLTYLLTCLPAFYLMMQPFTVVVIVVIIIS